MSLPTLSDAGRRITIMKLLWTDTGNFAFRCFQCRGDDTDVPEVLRMSWYSDRWPTFAGPFHLSTECCLVQELEPGETASLASVGRVFRQRDPDGAKHEWPQGDVDDEHHARVETGERRRQDRKGESGEIEIQKTQERIRCYKVNFTLRESNDQVGRSTAVIDHVTKRRRGTKSHGVPELQLLSAVRI